MRNLLFFYFVFLLFSCKQKNMRFEYIIASDSLNLSRIDTSSCNYIEDLDEEFKKLMVFVKNDTMRVEVCLYDRFFSDRDQKIEPVFYLGNDSVILSYNIKEKSSMAFNYDLVNLLKLEYHIKMNNIDTGKVFFTPRRYKGKS